MPVSYTITISDEADKAICHYVSDPQALFQNYADNKTRKCIDKIVQKESDYNPQKITETDKLDIVKNATLKTRAELDAEAMAEINN